MLATVTPAKGVVLAPVTNFGLRDAAAGTVTVNSSVGAGKKLERVRRDPHVALAFHTRAHGSSDRPEYVLVQGVARLGAPQDGYAWTIADAWTRKADPLPAGRLWRRWLRVYHRRVPIEVAVRRILVWPDLSCRGEPEVHGEPLPGTAPAPQAPPRGGTSPRVAHRRVARRAARLPDTLLGWAGADGLPMVVPVSVAGAGDTGIAVRAEPGLVPMGGRRAGLTAHRFTAHVLGQDQRVMTGWLDGEALTYAPHTLVGYRLPPNRTLYRLVVGLETRRRYRATGP